MVSYSRFSRSAGSQGWASGSGSLALTGPEPNMSFWPDERSASTRWAWATTASNAAKTRARFFSSTSKQPAAARFSSVRLLRCFTGKRLAKSARSVNGSLPREATSASTACPPTPLDGRHGVDDLAVHHRESRGARD